MPNGTHWEWRGFGPVDDDVRREFERLPLKFALPWDETKDEYLWIPGCEINVKLRTEGQQQGLKLKRFVTDDRDLELWFEDPKELFPFVTLDAAMLQQIAATLNITLSTLPEPPPTKDKALQALRDASPAPSIVTIMKRRQTRAKSEALQVELAEIKSVTTSSGPVHVEQPWFSLAIENALDLTGLDQRSVNASRDEVDALVNSLQLRGKRLRPMNYLKAIDAWLSQST